MFSRSCSVLLLVLLPFSACNCQRPENIAAKERLMAPPPPDPIKRQGAESLNAEGLETPGTERDRVMRMSAREAGLRLGAFRLSTEGELEFSREDIKVKSAEKVKIALGPEGHFSIHVVTGDEGEQRVAYINDILFLKNNNGRWRASRDPAGEREELLDDSGGIWRSFYDLFSHTLVLKQKGSTRFAGRRAIEYSMTLPDEREEAEALGAKEPVSEVQRRADGGVIEVDPQVEKERMRDRLSSWRKKARPAGGRGELRVDAETGVILYVQFKGRLAVGDGPQPGMLRVSLKHSVSDVGADIEVEAPKDAIEEFVRKKWPTDPRTPLEKAGLVPPLPKEEDKPAAGEDKK
jgi:hypothetical protein